MMKTGKITSQLSILQQVIAKIFFQKVLILAILLNFNQISFGNEPGEQSTQTLIGQNIRLGPQIVGSAIASHNIEIEGTNVKNQVIAGKSVFARDCRIEGKIVSGKDVILQNCPLVNLVTTGKNLTLINTTAQDIKSGGQITLNKALIHGNVTSGHGARIRNSQIKGTLTTSTNHLILDNSRIRQIRLYPAGSVNYNGSGISVRSATGTSLINISNGSVSSVNGFVIKGLSDKTILITPEETLYINGLKISGLGPESYLEYQQQNPKAPVINGPGWYNNNFEMLHPQVNNTPLQTIELINGTNVSEDILFEGGRGQVILHPGTTFSGKISGGVIVKQ